MKKINILFVIFITLFFVGCTRTTVPLSPLEYEKHPVLYEVDYNFTCSNEKGELAFTKGDRFVPVTLGGKRLANSQYSSALPKDALGIKIYEDIIVVWYALIYPNGDFVSNCPFAAPLDASGDILMPIFGCDVCKLKDGVSPFIQIIN